MLLLLLSVIVTRYKMLKLYLSWPLQQIELFAEIWMVSEEMQLVV